MNKLWIIDDDEVFTYLVKTKIEMAKGLDSVKSFLSPDEPLEELKKCILEGLSLPSVILLDINMPIMTGWEFIDKMIELNINFKSTKVFVISSSSSSSDKKKADKYPEVDYIEKPITNEKIEILKKYY